MLVHALFALLACAAPGVDSTTAGPLELLPTPCGAAPIGALVLASGGRGWLACGAGLFVTEDAGDSFALDLPAPRVEIAELLLEPDGALLACGREADGRGLLWRRGAAGRWERLLGRGEVGGLRACGSVARAADGALAVAGPRQAGLALRGAAGGAWRQPGGWWQGGEPPRLYDLTASSRGWAALGAGVVDPPAFLASGGADEPLPLLATVPDPDLAGELWVLATPDDGATWLVGGRAFVADEGSEGVLLRSSDGGGAWERMPLAPGLGWVRAIAFGRDGRCGVAVGQRTLSAEGGFVLVSGDGGDHWVEVEAAVPALATVAVLDPGFVAGGAGGALVRGWCP